MGASDSQRNVSSHTRNAHSPRCRYNNARMHPANAIAAVLLVIVFGAGMPAQESVPAASRYGAFAFADGEGKRLLVTPGIPEPARLHTALCTGGTGFPVRFEQIAR